MDIRLSGLAGPSNGTNKAQLETLTGFSLIRDGNDWVVPDADPCLRSGPRDVLRTSAKPSKLVAANFSQIAADFAENFLNDYFEERLKQPSEKVAVFGEWGVRTPLEVQQLNLFLTPRNLVVDRLTKETFPFFVDTLQAKSVSPIGIDADYQQALISISKIASLLEYKGMQIAQKHVNLEQGQNAALPTPIDVLAYVEALNTMSPSAITLPMHRMASGLHFMSHRPWFFPRLAIENIFEQLSTRIQPLTDRDMSFFTHGRHIQERAINAYFVSSVESVNRLMRYLNDIRTFVDSVGVFRPMSMAKAHSAVRLLFTDWQSISFTNSRYMKFRMVFAFLDKLANFIAMMRGVKNEDEIAKGLCSLATGLKISRLLRANVGAKYHSLGLLLGRMAEDSYQCLHDHIKAEMRGEGNDEVARLQYIRTLRNSVHGAYLRSNQFEEVFLAAGGTISNQFTFIPLLLLWGLVSNPSVFVAEI